MNAKIFLVNGKNIEKINKFFLSIGFSYKQEFQHDKKGNLYLLINFIEKAKE